MFSKRKKCHKITFKACSNANNRILSILFSNAIRFDMEIVSIELNGSYVCNTIIIKCSDEDKIRFIEYFSEEMGRELASLNF